MNEKLVRIKKLKTGEHMMVTPAYAARTKMLKNSGWVVEDLPEVKEILSESAKGAAFEKAELGKIIKGTFEEHLEEVLIEKSIDISLENQSEEVDLLEVKEENQAPKPRGRQKGSKNK